MIYTLTLNPAVDHVIKVNDFSEGTLNRIEEESFFPGGKGINVSIMLSHLGVENKALGFLAGFTGRFIEEKLQEKGCCIDFIYLEHGCTRINTKMNCNGKETEINGQGSCIQKKELLQLYRRIEQMDQGDCIVLSGSIPQNMSPFLYEEILDKVKNKKIEIVADTTKEKMLGLLKYHPFLIKPNKQELEEMFHTKCLTEKELIFYAHKLQRSGARNVLVSMDKDGALFLSEEGRVYKVIPPKKEVVNSVGAGDAMVAGFLAGYLKTKDKVMALKTACASGSATAFQSFLAEKPEIIEVYNEVTVINI